MKRRDLLRIYDPIYRETGRYGDPCTYCGQVSDTLDHIPPLVMVGAMASTGANLDAPFIKVPACHECNSILGAVNRMRIRDRRAHVKDALRKKYKKFLRIPNWDEDELEEVDPAFAREIRASVNFAKHVRARLKWHR